MKDTSVHKVWSRSIIAVIYSSGRSKDGPIWTIIGPILAISMNSVRYLPKDHRMELFRKIWVMPDIMEGIPADILVDILCHNLDIRAMAHAVPIIRECRKQRFEDVSDETNCSSSPSGPDLASNWPVFTKCLTFQKSVKDSSGWNQWRKRKKKRRKRNHQVSHQESTNPGKSEEFFKLCQGYTTVHLWPHRPSIGPL